MLEVEENKGVRVAGNIVVKAVTCTHLLHTYIKITALGQERERESTVYYTVLYESANRKLVSSDYPENR